MPTANEYAQMSDGSRIFKNSKAPPSRVRQQYGDLCTHSERLGRTECERLYPDLIEYVRKNISLLDLVRESGFTLRSVSEDAPDTYVAEGACPCCAHDMFVRDKP